MTEDIARVQELIGHEVRFPWKPCNKKSKVLNGTVIRPGRVPGTVLIQSPRASFHNRHINEIQVLS